MKKRFPWTAACLALALAVMTGAAMRGILKSERYEIRLREMYDGAVLSALRQMEDMELSLSKALLCQERGAQAQYLNQVSLGAAQVQRSLSLLPLSHTATRNAVKFANQVSDYTASLLKASALSEEDAKRLDTLISACREYAAALYAARDSVSAQAALGTAPFYPVGQEEEKTYDSAVSYPTLIYDGPFSDAREEGRAKGLPSQSVTQAEARQIVGDFLDGQAASLKDGAETGGSIPCWGVTAVLGDITVQAAVTKQGGKILWMAPDTADFSPLRSVEECRENALAFLERNGFGSMQATYFQVYEGVAVISFAATQGNTLLYPDLVKVQLRLDTAQVVGWEARNYWQNHTARGALRPQISEDEAREKAGARLNIQSSRLCLIPTDSGEKLCYEFQGEFGGHTYLSYINALDGRQEQLLKVIEGATGLEAV